jgi:hypothetical protein
MRTKDVTIDGEEWRLVADDELGVVSAVNKADPAGDCRSWYDRRELIEEYGCDEIQIAMLNFLGKPSAWKPAEMAPEGVDVLVRSRASRVVLGVFKKSAIRGQALYDSEYAEIPE